MRRFVTALRSSISQHNSFSVSFAGPSGLPLRHGITARAPRLFCRGIGTAICRPIPSLPRPSAQSPPTCITTIRSSLLRCCLSSQAGEAQAQRETTKGDEEDPVLDPDPDFDPLATTTTAPPPSTTMNGANSTTKRKASFPSEDRPPKQRFLPANGGIDSPGLNTPDGERDITDHEDEEMTSYYPSQPADTAEWQATVEKVIRNVVSIRFCQTCAFDTDAALTSEATGFVVDAEQGYVISESPEPLLEPGAPV
jgi:hypothetical protein